MSDIEYLYYLPSYAIAFGLLILILVCNQIGFRLGTWSRNHAGDVVRPQANAIQAATLGLLALLLGFSFSMAMQRHDARAHAVVTEANAIGTAKLRVDLLPAELRAGATDLLDRYIQLRVSAGAISLDRESDRDAAALDSIRMQAQLWALATQSAELDPSPVRSGLFAQALNDVFDAQTARTASLDAHVPEVVLFLLFGVFGIAGAIIGYAGGLEGGQPRTATVLMSVLIVLVIFMIIDLDRPRRGLITVPQQSMQQLLTATPSTQRATDSVAAQSPQP